MVEPESASRVLGILTETAAGALVEVSLDSTDWAASELFGTDAVARVRIPHEAGRAFALELTLAVTRLKGF